MPGGNFFSELKRRNVYRVGAAYTVAAFVLLEVVSNAAPILDLPGWIGRVVILMLIVGFPAVLSFAWVYEFTPDGLKRTTEVENGASVTYQTGHRLNIVIIGLIVVLAGLYSADRFLLRHEAAEGAARTSAGAPPNASTTEGISIAVLPFVNLSGDPSQEFFSDGMTEEITSALAKVKALRVVGRTSAFKFKGQNEDLRAIGQALSAGHILEGSVRKSGNRVRITAQLIRADDGTHIWTENYDRELTDIFATQDDIAQAIAGALRIPLGLKQGETLVASRTGDTDTYQEYLRAKALVRARSPLAAITVLEQVVARDPAFAPAWALVAQAYALSPQDGTFYLRATSEQLRTVSGDALAKAEVAGRRAVELDPRNADAYVGLALAAQRRSIAEVEDLYKQALKLDALNPDALHFYSIVIAQVGRVKEALAIRQQLRALEPFVPIFNTITGLVLWTDGQAEAALAIAESVSSAEPGPGDLRARIYASMGLYKEAADLILSRADRYAPGAAETAARFLRLAPVTIPRKDLPELQRFQYVYLYIGAPERALENLNGVATAGYYGNFIPYLHPTFAPARKTETFKAFVRDIGLVEYWRARGWTGPCKPVGAEDFECD